MTDNQEPISKNIKRVPIKWSVTHPDGHMYSMQKLDSLLARFGRTKTELKALGWKFEAHYAPTPNSNIL